MAVLVRAALILNAEIKEVRGVNHFLPAPADINISEMERFVGPCLSIFLQWLIAGVSNKCDLMEPPIPKDDSRYSRVLAIGQANHYVASNE